MKNYQSINLENKKAVFVDCDGTLADTMTAHNKAYELSFLLNEVPFYEDKHKKWAPYGGKILMKETVEEIGYGDKVDEIIEYKQSLLSICLKKYMRPNEGLIKFVRSLPFNIEIYVVTNGRYISIMKILEALGLNYEIDGLISKENVPLPKPAPNGYILAMNLTNAKPEEVVVFEDNEIGASAALAAGIKDIYKVNTEDFSYEKI